MMMQDIQVSSTQGVPCVLFSSQATPPQSRLYPGTCYCASEIAYPLPEELGTVELEYHSSMSLSCEHEIHFERFVYLEM